MIVDGTDNFPTRYLVNDACVLLGKPNVYGSIFRFDGQASVFFPPHGPCYRCLYPVPPPPDLVPNCAEGGVLGILPGLIGVVQATETVKLILGTGRPLIGRLMLYDALDMSVRELKVRKNPKCPICGPNPTITGLIDYQEFCGVRGAEAAPTASTEDGEVLSALELKAMLDRGDRPFILDVRNPPEIEICRIAGSTVIPLPELAEPPGRARPLRADGRPLQERRPQRQGDRAAPRGGIHPPEEPDRRHPRLGQGRRPEPPHLLSRAFAGSTRTRPLQRRAPCDIFHVPRASRCRPGSGRRSDAPARGSAGGHLG